MEAAAKLNAARKRLRDECAKKTSTEERAFLFLCFCFCFGLGFLISDVDFDLELPLSFRYPSFENLRAFPHKSRLFFRVSSSAAPRFSQPILDDEHAPIQ
eukprot:scaffold3346_cov313-Pinguiococcus_pyrenoidosus.AAC.10